MNVKEVQLQLEERDFRFLKEIIYKESGIKMADTKRDLVQARLMRRMRELRIDDYGIYSEYLRENYNSELVNFINCITTNKTDFFREPSHFSFLIDRALPTLQAEFQLHLRRPLRIWSAGCSTGEEPYTLAMVLAEVQETRPAFRYEIIATDISTRVLEVARRAVYPMERIDPISPLYRKKYLLRGRDKNNPEIRIVPELRKKIRFGRLNFMVDDFALPESVDVIFCRNVIIYFDKATQEQLMHKFSRYLNRGGYLFLGHSESLHGYETPFVQVAPTIYRKP